MIDADVRQPHCYGQQMVAVPYVKQLLTARTCADYWRAKACTQNPAKCLAAEALPPHKQIPGSDPCTAMPHDHEQVSYGNSAAG